MELSKLSGLGLDDPNLNPLLPLLPPAENENPPKGLATSAGLSPKEKVAFGAGDDFSGVVPLSGDLAETGICDSGWI